MFAYFRKYCVIPGAVMALVCMVSLPVGAQQKSETGSAPGHGVQTRLQPLPDGGPAPRLTDGHPDFSGMWFQGSLGTENAQLTDGPPDPATRAFDPSSTPKIQIPPLMARGLAIGKEIRW
jgi:hypothetical protein